MRKRRAAVLVLCAALCGGRAAAQVFPNDQAPRAAFPATFTLFVFGGFQANRITRTYNKGTIDPTDARCDSIADDCRSIHGLAGSPGIGMRAQFPVTARSGIRLGVSATHPGRRMSTRDGSQVLVAPENVTLLRVDGLILFRLKPQVPIYFGLGATLASYTPGTVHDQGPVTEVGAAFAVGIDHQMSPTIGTRAEFTGFVMKPNASGIQAPAVQSEYTAHAHAFDGQISFGFNFLLGKKKK
jgi:hypothetical protein